jgi:DNA polymerase III sliding clamp (beta) subunit (PCNA family)
VASQKSAQGKSNSSILIRSLEGEPVKFACNGKYVLDFLGSLEGDEVMIQGNESLKPVLFSVPESQDVLYLIMPFKLPDES